MIKQRLNEVLISHQFVDSSSAVETFDELCELMMKRFSVEKQNEYAFVVLGKLDDREGRYIQGGEFDLVTQNNRFLWLFNQKGHQFWVPFANQLEKV